MYNVLRNSISSSFSRNLSTRFHILSEHIGDRQTMRDIKVGTSVIFRQAESPYNGRVGIVSVFTRNPKNDAIEKFEVNFGEDKNNKPLIVNIDDLRTISRFSVDSKQDV